MKETRININVSRHRKRDWKKPNTELLAKRLQKVLVLWATAEEVEGAVHGQWMGETFAWGIQHLFDVMFWYFLTPTRDATRRATNVPQWKRNELITCISKQKLVRNISQRQRTRTQKQKRKPFEKNEADYLNEMILWIEKWPPGMRDNIKRLPKPSRTELTAQSPEVRGLEFGVERPARLSVTVIVPTPSVAGVRHRG